MSSDSLDVFEKKALYKDQIKDMLKQAIVSGELKPGERIIETRWARQLGVSQAPVREAIRELEIMGYIENIPYKGSLVREITTQEVMESFKIRRGLEKIAMEEACERISDRELKKVRSELDLMEKAAEENDIEEYLKRNTNFHRAIVEATHNRLLLRLWEQCDSEAFKFHNTSIIGKALPELARRHEAIYDAVAARDKETAIKAAREHVDQLAQELFQE